MSDYVGTPIQVEIQKRLHDTHSDIAKNPGLANGGRLLNVLDIDAVGWDQIRKFAERDQFIALTAVPMTQTLTVLREKFGPKIKLPYWKVFFGAPDRVLTTCAELLRNTILPDGWQIRSYEQPDTNTIQAIQDLNGATDVAPTPAYYLRSDVVPSLTTCLWDETHTLVACANATMRYHPGSPMAHTLFAGSVSVCPTHRRKGFGTSINAALLRDSHSAFNWRNVMEQAKPDNDASCAMIRKCGLQLQTGLVTIALNLSAADFTR